ncbi:outer membrane insertion C- signal [Winogradskyella flava]|uniref:Outer membrane insertion C- signal n=1 Tax=Winogradskyella flava TaxID=1884876 RepID=A0A842IQ04_9FLAO|nr:outer membrane insertion C- signal [Winogradskyella flava]MBC2844775.1 outer membrane insertion C- signal [Winogradskyella flava]
MRIIVLGLVLLLSTTINAQEIGVRFGEVTGNNIAVDGVFEFDGSRIHANVSFGDGLGLDALYDFIYESLEDELYWYAGVGASTFIEDDFNLGVSGEIGLEYQFDSAPIVIGFDYRPTFWIIDDTSFKWDGFGVNVRYRF